MLQQRWETPEDADAVSIENKSLRDEVATTSQACFVPPFHLQYMVSICAS